MYKHKDISDLEYMYTIVHDMYVIWQCTVYISSTYHIHSIISNAHITSHHEDFHYRSLVLPLCSDPGCSLWIWKVCVVRKIICRMFSYVYLILYEIKHSIIYYLYISYHGAHNNAARQLYVNHVAESVGAGIGTARQDGVPGVYGYGRVGYGNGHVGYGYGNGHVGYGYGHDAYGSYGRRDGYGYGHEDNGIFGYGNGHVANYHGESYK